MAKKRKVRKPARKTATRKSAKRKTAKRKTAKRKTAKTLRARRTVRMAPLVGSDGNVVPRSKMTAEMKHVEVFIAEIVTRLQTGEPVPQELIDSLPRGIRVELPIEAQYGEGQVTIGMVTIEDGHVMYHRLHDSDAPPDKTTH